MFIRKIVLKNFRNYDSLELSAAPGINVIYGKNGQGKTNILEALFLCAIGKSFRTSHDVEMIKNGKKEYFVEVYIEDNLFSKISVRYDRKKSKIICVDGACISKMRFLMGKLVGVMFSPEDMRLVSDGPSQRRKFIDIAICQLSSSYYHALLMYNKAVKEKNSLLMTADLRKMNRVTLDVYNEAIAEYGSIIYCERLYFINRLSHYAAESHKFISEKNEELCVKYLPSCNYLVNFNYNCEQNVNKNIIKEDIKRNLYSELCSEKNVSRETEQRKSLIGPHRDDFDVFFNGVNLKQYGSQGQKRTAVISVKHAELQIMKEITGRTPILFLDDVMSELDSDRKKKIVECFKDVQTFITCADHDIVEFLNKSDISANFINAEFLK